MLWNPMSIEDVRNKEFHNAFRQLKEEGKVRFCGISCHGSDIPGLHRTIWRK